MAVLVVVIIASIYVIIYFKNKINPEEQLMKCIAEKSHLYISKTCSFCAQQKIILGDFMGLFNMTDCLNETKLCVVKGIKGWPTWEIGNQSYIGLKSIKELKDLTNC